MLVFQVTEEETCLAIGKKGSKKVPDEEEFFDEKFVPTKSIKDANSTITWSEVQTEKNCSVRNMKSPVTEKVCLYSHSVP